MNLRTVPSVAVKIDLIDIINTFKAYNKNIYYVFKENLKSYFNYDKCIIFPKARLGLTNLLKVLSINSLRDEVVIPAYTCPTVLYSVVYSGLKPIFVDIDLDDFNISFEKTIEIVNSNTLAVVAVNMFGKRAKIEILKNYLKQRGIFLIEDAAQSAGKMNNNENADFLLLSFGRAKNFSAIEGGAVLSSNRKIMSLLNNNLNNYSKITINRKLLLILKLFIYPFAVNPYIYNIIKRIPHKENIIDIINSCSGFNFSLIQSALGNVLLSKLDELNKIRIRNAIKIYDFLKNNKNYYLQSPINNVYLRFALVCKQINKNGFLIEKLNKFGINATTANFPVLSNLYIKNNIRKFPNSIFVSSNILTLPTHSYLKNEDIKKIKYVLCISK